MGSTMALDPRQRAAPSGDGLVLSRRSLVAALGIGSGGLFAACDRAGPDRDRSDRSNPTRQPAPTEPLADTDLLLRTWQDTRRLRRMAQQAIAEPAEREALADTDRILGVQEVVLGRLVQAQRGGTDLLTDTAAEVSSPPGSTDGTSVTDEPQAGVNSLAEALAPGEETQRVLRGVSGSNLPTLLSLHGARSAAAARLGFSPGWSPMAGPSGAAAITLLASLRQAVYGFEVLAARSRDQERTGYRAALSALRPLTRAVTDLAGPAAPAPPLGYAWRQPLDTPARRNRAAQELAEPLPAAAMAGASARAGDTDAIAGTLHVMHTVVGVGAGAGLPIVGFPGLTVPEANS